MNAIDVRGLTKRFGDKLVVSNVSLSVKSGEIVGFLGPNGSGKTTSIRMMCGLLKPDEGQGQVLGYDLIRDRLHIKSQVGYMTQKFSFYEDLTIEENLSFVARLYNLKPIARHTKETLEKLGLYSRRNQLAGQLSGGWKQRLALAACTMHNPRLLLLDEPTAGVDPKARRDFWDEIHRLAADGMTVLVSTHYMDEAERCHRITYISYGKLLADGSLKDVIAGAGLHTYTLSGPNIESFVPQLQEEDGVQQIAPFGNALHVTSTNHRALKRALKPLEEHSDVVIEQSPTSLEDVFIKFMSDSTDNMQ